MAAAEVDTIEKVDAKANVSDSNGRLSGEELRAQLGVLESKLNAAKIAYLHRTSLNGRIVTHGDLSAIAKEYIQTSYAIQKEQFGAVKVRMSVAKLLR